MINLIEAMQTVGKLETDTQQMLLCAIQERRYRPIGDKSMKMLLPY